jgi:hypothetical protein
LAPANLGDEKRTVLTWTSTRSKKRKKRKRRKPFEDLDVDME